MEAVQYVEINEQGSVVIAGTRIHVEAVGFAHEGGSTEEELLEWFDLNKEQFYGALAYFYGHRADLIVSENEAVELAKELSQNGLEKLQEWRKKQSK
ncbi:MAG: DUF433 domain-containing protein [Anaerolineae bacterium]|nr:DUF433 domain-containing protein [Anaerolineae bacterium]MDQ7034689.1 DUF433 domain-containing protein [Anaerolineae bacterium]